MSHNGVMVQHMTTDVSRYKRLSPGDSMVGLNSNRIMLKGRQAWRQGVENKSLCCSFRALDQDR